MTPIAVTLLTGFSAPVKPPAAPHSERAARLQNRRHRKRIGEVSVDDQLMATAPPRSKP
ncbi:hypothetical protein ACVXG7_18980 [Enterobacter hormaechei]